MISGPKCEFFVEPSLSIKCSSVARSYIRSYMNVNDSSLSYIRYSGVRFTHTLYAIPSLTSLFRRQTATVLYTVLCKYQIDASLMEHVSSRVDHNELDDSIAWSVKGVVNVDYRGWARMQITHRWRSDRNERFRTSVHDKPRPGTALTIELLGFITCMDHWW